MLSNLLPSVKPHCKHAKLYKQVKQKWDHQLLLWKSALSLLIKTVYCCAYVFKASAGECAGKPSCLFLRLVHIWHFKELLNAGIFMLLFRLEVGI